MKKNTIGFSLVELLVTITIISILATIAYLYFDGNVGKSRDSKRITDLAEIEKALEVYFTKKWSFPEPTGWVDITYSGSSLAWTQGTFGLDTNRDLRVFWSEYPLDPLFENEYTYSLLNTKKEFQISSLRENIEQEDGLWEQVISLLGPTQVQAGQIETAYVVWNYNGFMVQVSDGAGQVYFIASPSITTRDIADTDIISIIENRKLVYDEFFNIPHSYNGYIELDGGFNFNVSDPLIFSGSLDDLKNEENLLEFNSKLKYIYATTPTESFEKYVAILEEEWLTSLKKFLTKTFKIPFRSYFNCKDIIDDNASTWDGLYRIDPDGAWWAEPYEVYCDMTTDGWGWTRVGDNHLANGDFAGGLWVVWAIENDATTNNVVALTTPVDGNEFALHQTGNYSSNYEILFDDPTLLQQWYEIRMSMWRSDYGSGALTEGSTSTNILPGKTNSYTLTASSWSRFNQKMNYAPNFWAGWLLTDIDITVWSMSNTVTDAYLDGWILFDGFLPDEDQDPYVSTSTYSSAEIDSIDSWVQAGWFLLSTNDDSRYDPLWVYYDMPSGEIWQDVSSTWEVQNIEHPLVNGSIGLWVDLRGKTLIGEQNYSALLGTPKSGDIILARDKYSPNLPTVILRPHGKWHILITGDEWLFRNMSSGNTFQSNDNEDAFAAAIMAYAIETAAGVNPHEWYVFHNRIHYNDGTFSTNGEDQILESITVDWKIWTKELVRSRIYKTPESFNWYLGLDANNNKDLYFTGLKLELFYK